MVDGFRLMWLQANSKEGTRLPDPVQIPRPGASTDKPEPVRMSLREFGEKWKG